VEVTVKEIIEYSFCPKLYFLKKDSELTPSLEEYYNDTLHRLMARFLFMARDGEVSAKELKMIWASCAIVQKRKHKFAYYNPVNWKSNLSEFNKKGVAAIDFLLNTYPGLLGAVIAINEPYIIKLTKNITIKGKWDLIQENLTTKEIEVVIFKEHDKLGYIPADQDYRSLLDTIAFRKTFNAAPGNTTLQSFNTERKLSGKISGMHLKEAIQNIANICSAISKGIVYKYPSYKCKSCPAKLICESCGQRTG
jgi:hypothetical protein